MVFMIKTILLAAVCMIAVAAALYLLMIMPRMLHRPDKTPFPMRRKTPWRRFEGRWTQALA